MSETIEQAFKMAVHQHLAPLEHDLITTFWDKAKGQTFPRVATIGVHGSATEFNLLTKAWQPSYAAFDQE